MLKKWRYKLRVMGPIGLGVLGVHFLGHNIYHKLRIPILRQIAWFCYYILDLIFVRIFANAELSPVCSIGDNLKIVHGGNGVIISSQAVIGNNVTIYHQVTIGVINNKVGAPIIGDNVFIGAGAKILGPITIGTGASIGANAVVLKDVPAGATAVGIPARIV